MYMYMYNVVYVIISHTHTYMYLYILLSFFPLQEIQIMRLDLSAQEQILMMLKEHLDTSDRLQGETKSPDVKQQ